MEVMEVNKNLTYVASNKFTNFERRLSVRLILVQANGYIHHLQCEIIC